MKGLSKYESQVLAEAERIQEEYGVYDVQGEMHDWAVSSFPLWVGAFEDNRPFKPDKGPVEAAVVHRMYRLYSERSWKMYEPHLLDHIISILDEKLFTAAAADIEFETKSEHELRVEMNKWLDRGKFNFITLLDKEIANYYREEE